MKRLLYIDLPFVGERGGDKNRSRFIWSTLSKRYEVDFLMIKHWKSSNFSPIIPENCSQTFVLNSVKPPLYKPESIFNFGLKEVSAFRQIVVDGRYDIVFFRFASPALLVEEFRKTGSKAKVIFDIDMLFSRLAELSWTSNPVFKNRFYFFESIKLHLFEKWLFRQPFLFLFTNNVERDIVVRKYQRSNAAGVFSLLPNVMQTAEYPLKLEKKNYILFFGALDSAANKDAFDFICRDIYPKISGVLKGRNIRLRVVGKNKPPYFDNVVSENKLEQIDLIGEVEDINKEIAESLFALLPLRVASGTRTRILEAACLKTAVLSNTIGAEGFNFESDELIIRDDPQEIAAETIKLIEHPELCRSMGEKIFAKSKEQYLDRVVAEKLITAIDSFRGNICM